MDIGRRRILGTSAGVAGSLFLPLPWAWVWAQDKEGALKLVKAPKLALVIGNSKYKDAPELKNPANDAKGIGDALKASGFAVTMKLDTSKDEMLGAIRDYVYAMEKGQHVGLFYFAGHGVQLAWRNYLLPIDAVIDKIDDVAKQSIDLARLMEGLTKAKNPMNVIILDACRENPFGKDFKVEHKGLSQMDAPGQTFLAYATSPGNVASDGDGSNGLYTENLLREMKVKEAKIEDVFKRVRLGVRRKTNGAQIPWESTSLEEDFWFLPPASFGPIAEAEVEKAFDAELELWEKIAESKDVAPFEDYLRRYPSGRFSELAQLQLDRALARAGEKRIEIAKAADNPFTKGTARANTAYKVGDSYAYVETDLETKTEKERFTDVVKEVRENEVVFDTGLVLDLLGNIVQLPDGRRFTARQDQPLEFAVGRNWTTRYSVRNERRGRSAVIEFEFRITGKERIVVPAGEFDCFVVEGTSKGVNDLGNVLFTSRLKRWFAPDRVRRQVAHEIVRTATITRKPKPPAFRLPPHIPPTFERVLESVRRELVSFKQA